MARLLTALLLFFCATIGAQSSTTNSLAFTHATVVDVVSGKLRSDQVVVVTGERIVAVGKTGKVKLPPDVQVVDATGKFLIPGLWDMHVHGTGDEIPSKLYIANGVTGVRDMFGMMPVIQAERKAIYEGKAGPRIVAAGRILDGPKPIWPGSIAIKDAEEGRKAVQTAKGEGSDFIKVYELLSRDAYFAIAAEAKRQGMVFAGHVPQAVTAAEASDAGQKSIEHLTGVIRGCFTRESKVVSGAGKQRRSEEATSVLESYNEKKAQTLFKRFKRNHTWQCPTLTVLYNLGHLDDTNLTSDPRRKYAPAELKDFWNSRKPHSTNGPSEWSLMMQKLYRKDEELVGKMRRVGVEFLAGTDVCNPYCFPGFSLHDELARLVEAGLTPKEALQTATINPARYFGREKELGTIQPGKLADLVLLDANPLQDIHNSTKIRGAVANGRYYDRAVLDKFLTDAEKDARTK